MKDAIIGIAVVVVVVIGFYMTRGGGGPPSGPNDPAFRIGPYGRIGDEPDGDDRDPAP